MAEDEVRTFPLSLEAEESGITVSIPWAQRQANGAVIARVHIQSPKHSAGELLLHEPDLITLDPDERPLRTQVRRFWGYTKLDEVSPAHMQTARFDVGFRLDLLSTGGNCGVNISIVRTFRPGEGPRAVGGPWVFKFRVTDDQEAAALARAETARQEAARQEAARQEAARQEALRQEAERREAIRQERARADAAREAAQAAAAQAHAAATPPDEAPEEPWPQDQSDSGRARRPGRFLRPEQAGVSDDEQDEARRPGEERRAAARQVTALAAVTPAAALAAPESAQTAEPVPARRPSRSAPRTARPPEAEAAEGSTRAEEAVPPPAPRRPARRPSRASTAESPEIKGNAPST